MPEGTPDQESTESLRQRVVEALRQSTEDLSLLNEFLDRRQLEVGDSRQGMMLNVEVAHMYKEAGLKELAKEAFLDAAEQAWHERDDDLFEKLTEEANAL
ncbi:MAG: hypothetical protein AB200_03035 [Parcubacteria bacterium C7867-005]|nr:MAG: hypothetical protein AB200_03035 [Parcubacteria bacterium C7867-005]